MKRLTHVLALAVLVTAATSVAAIAGEKYKGTWTGEGGKSTLEIKSEKPLIIRYCYNNRCDLHEPSGSVKSMTVRYPKRDNFPGATMKLKKSGATYKGTYKIKGDKSVYTVTMKK